MSSQLSNLFPLFLDRLKPPKWLTNIKCKYLQLLFLHQLYGANGHRNDFKINFKKNYVARLGFNWWPLDLPSDVLPTALWIPAKWQKKKYTRIWLPGRKKLNRIEANYHSHILTEPFFTYILICISHAKFLSILAQASLPHIVPLKICARKIAVSRNSLNMEGNSFLYDLSPVQLETSGNAPRPGYPFQWMYTYLFHFALSHSSFFL